MSGFSARVRENRQERREERHEAHQERHNYNHGSRHDADDHQRYDDGDYGHGRGHGLRQGYGDQGYEQDQGYGYGSQQRIQDLNTCDDDPRRPQGYGGGGRGGSGGYAPPPGPPPGRTSGFATQGGLDRGDFATDEDIERMVTSGELSGLKGPPYERRGEGGYGGVGRGSGGVGDRYGASPGPPPGQGYSNYDAPSGPPPGQGYRRQDPRPQGYESSGGYGTGYSGGSDRPNQYGLQQGEKRPQGPPSSYGTSQGNAPSGGFTASGDGEDQYGSGRGGDSDGPPRRGEAHDYYGRQDQRGGGDRYAHLADIAREHGDDPEMYRKATQGLQQRIQSQNVRPGQNDDGDYQGHVDAHRKAYGGDDHEPMDTDAIGAAAAMEAFKQTAGAANRPSGELMGGKPSGGPPSKPGPGAGKEAEEEEAEEGPAEAGGRGMQDKLMALAMSHAGKLFDKKNSSGGTSGGGDKAQAMQSAAATAMQLFTQYQTKGKLDSGDMALVMGLAKNLF